MIIFEGFLFDVDDTLYNRRAAFVKWAKRYISEILRVTDRSTLDKIFASTSVLDSNGYGSKKELIEEFMLLYPPPFDSAYDATQAYVDFFTETVLDGPADTLLKYLEDHDLPFGIVSNGGPRQMEKMKKLGLTGRVNCLFVSETFGIAKPGAEIFNAAADCLGFPASTILFVGDHPINDIQGAHDAGMLTAWLHNNQPWPQDLVDLKPDVTIGSLDELMPLLRQKAQRNKAATERETRFEVY